MSLSAGLFPRDHGLSQPHSLTPSLHPFPTAMSSFSVPPGEPQGDTPTPGQASSSSGSKPSETFNKKKYGGTAERWEYK